jgi:hypothetical protein
MEYYLSLSIVVDVQISQKHYYYCLLFRSWLVCCTIHLATVRAFSEKRREKSHKKLLVEPVNN